MSEQATVELLSRFLDDDLSPEERGRVETLLESSESSRRTLEDLRAVARQLAELEVHPPPPHLRQALRRLPALEAERSRLMASVHRQVARWIQASHLLPAFAVTLAMASIVYMLAEGVARRGEDRIQVILTPSEQAPPELLELAGRTFEQRADGWIEAGISEAEAAAPDEVVVEDAARAWLAGRAELAPLGELSGTVLLRVEGRIVAIHLRAGP